MSQMKSYFDRRGTKLPYNIENGQIQETNGSNEYLTVKFNFSSGEQWVSLSYFINKTFFKSYLVPSNEAASDKPKMGT